MTAKAQPDGKETDPLNSQPYIPNLLTCQHKTNKFHLNQSLKGVFVLGFAWTKCYFAQLPESPRGGTQADPMVALIPVYLICFMLAFHGIKTDDTLKQKD